MRTTLTIADDVLEAARELAMHQGRSVGEVVSELARKGLKPVDSAPKYRNGIRLLPSTPGRVVTLELVNRLRDELP